MKEKTCEVTFAKLRQGGRELATEPWAKICSLYAKPFYSSF